MVDTYSSHYSNIVIIVLLLLLLLLFITARPTIFLVKFDHYLKKVSKSHSNSAPL